MKKITLIVLMVFFAFSMSTYLAEQKGVVLNGQIPVASSTGAINVLESPIRLIF
ncbi:MAG: hypothetical protein H7843_11390 [Nitrospirota bacterium]